MRYEFHNGQLDIMDGKKYENKPLAAFFNDYRISRKNRSLILTNHQLLANGIPLFSEEDIIPSGVLTLLIPEEEPDWVAAAKPCPVVYSDPFIYLAHKEAGIIIHGDENDVTCLNAQAARYQRDNGINAPVRPIHRLDYAWKEIRLRQANRQRQTSFWLLSHGIRRHVRLDTHRMSRKP